MIETDFVMASLISAYVLGWTFGLTTMYFKRTLEVTT
jgi:hypothetical protein